MSRTEMRRCFAAWMAASICVAFTNLAAAQNSSLYHQAPPRTAVAPWQRIPGQGMAQRTAPAGAAGERGQFAPPPGASPDGLPAAGERFSVGGNRPGASFANPDRPPIQLSGASWTYLPAPPVRVFHKNDIVTIRVDEIARVLAEGSAENRKQTAIEAILTDWVRISKFRLRPDPQPDGDPTAAAESNTQYRAEASVESRESMTFNIAATVVDIRPNGSLVLEAKKTIRLNDNLWETSLSGICRSQDIGPDNVILSKDLLDLEIRKLDRGHLRDGYRRGLFTRLWDRAAPF